MANIKPANPVTTVSDPIWLEQPSLLFTHQRWKEFFPTRNMSRERIFNASSRLIIYLTVLLFVYSRRVTYLSMGLLAIALGYAWYRFYPKLIDTFGPTPANTGGTDSTPDIQDQYVTTPPPRTKRHFKYVEPTTNNPFMNVMPDDYTKNPDRASVLEKPCDNFQQTQAQVDEKFHQGLFHDVGDVFGRDASQRQFYTTPNTSIPNDQDVFARWLYKSEPTCKQGSCEATSRHIGR
jgi:hypothetical protein